MTALQIAGSGRLLASTGRRLWGEDLWLPVLTCDRRPMAGGAAIIDVASRG